MKALTCFCRSGFRTVIALIIIFFTVQHSYGQNRAYEVWYSTINFSNTNIANTGCSDPFSEAEASFVGRFNDNVDGGVNSQCFTCEIPFLGGSCFLASGTVAYRNRTNDAGQINYSFDGWEDDSGDRCSFDSDGGDIFNDDDDCPISSSGSIGVSNINGATQTTQVLNDTWLKTGISYRWYYVSVLTPNQTPTSSTAGCCRTYNGWAPSQSNVTWYWQTSSTGTSTANSTSSAYTVCSSSPGQTSVTRYIRARGNRTGGWSGARTITVNFPADPTSPTLSAATPSSGSTICPLSLVSATFNNGTGGTGCTNDYRYSVNSGGTWNTYTPGSNVPAGLNGTTTLIQGRRNCTGGSCDGSGETYVNLASWFVIDNTTPIAVCNNVTIQLDGSGNASLAASQVGGGSSDNCTANLSVSKTSFNCSDAGSNTVTMTVSDNAAHSASCTATVTVVDNTQPTILCPVSIALNNDPGLCGAVFTYDLPVGTDNCVDMVTLTGLGSGALFPVGGNTETYTVTDVSGNTGSCSFTVTVDDVEPLVVLCQNVNVQLDNNGEALVTPNQLDNGSSDNCGIATLVIVEGGDGGLALTCADLGSLVATLIVTDNGGNTGTCTGTITVTDPLMACNLPPVAVCQNVTVSADGNCQGSASASAFDSGSSDPDGDELTLSVNPTGPYSLGTTNVTLTVTDPIGLSDQCAATITVVDNANPVIANCPINISVNNDPGVCGAIVTWPELDITDNCPGVQSFITGLGSGAVFPIGTSPVVVDAVDANGNTTNCSFTVTVNDTENPVPNCPANITVNNDINVCGAVVTYEESATDNCPGVSTFQIGGLGSGSTFPVGSTVESYTAVDASGNNVSCSFSITVIDSQSPVVSCQNITVQLDAGGNGSGSVFISATDNCGAPAVDEGQTQWDCSDVGDHSITVTATDVNGNVGSCTATATIQDNVAPIAICQNITIELDDFGFAPFSEGDFNNGTSDACGIAGWEYIPTEFPCGSIGENSVTPIVTDNNGNSSTCTITVTVEDNISPQALCNDLTIQLDDDGLATISPDDVDNESSDNCGVSLSLDDTDFDCSDLAGGDPAPSIWINEFHYDNDGGDVGEFAEVGGTAGYDLTGHSLVFYNGANGEVYVTRNLSGSIDDEGAGYGAISENVVGIQNGAPDGIALVDDGGTVIEFVSYEGSLTATNGPANGLTSTDVGVFEPGSNPIGTTIQRLGDISSSFVLLAGGSPGSLNAGQVFTSGPLTVVLTATDPGGNSNSCEASITLEDNVPPVAVCQDFTVQLDGSGSASITPDDINNGSNDACNVTGLTLSNDAFSCSDIAGSGPDVWINEFHYDNDGGDVGEFVEVAGVASVDLINYSIVLYNGATGLSYNTVALAGLIDNEGAGFGAVGFLISGIQNGGPDGIALIGPSGVVEFLSYEGSFTALDGPANGLTSVDIGISQSASTVAGNSLGRTGGPSSGFVEWIPNSIGSLNAGQAIATGSGVPVTLTVQDANGNTSTCSANVTVEDNVAGVAECRDVTVQLDASGNGSITPEDLDNGSVDACGIQSLSLDLQNFDCSDIDDGSTPTGVWINEFHYDNDGGDVGEFVEIAGYAGTDLTGYIVVAYNGNGGTQYGAAGLSGLINDDDNGIGYISISLGLQNGAPDGIALIGPSGVVEFLSYEGSFTATDGGANGSTSTDVGVSENSSTPIGYSIQRLGGLGSAFAAPQPQTPGAINTGQAIPSGSSLEVVLTVTDNNGNESTCTANVTVEDNIDPTPSCVGSVTYTLDQFGERTLSQIIVENVINTGSSDNCAIESYTLSQTVFTCDHVGANTVTLTVEDVNGNTAECTATIQIEDNTKPEALCQDVTVQLDATGNGGLTPGQVDNGSNDACGVANTFLVNSEFDCTDVGTQNTFLHVVDVNGNEGVCQASVSIQDNVAPIAICQDLTVELDASGNGSILPSEMDNGSSDVCGIADISFLVADDVFGQLFYACNLVGLLQTETVSVTDVNGNTSTCTGTVTVLDLIPPEPICQDLTIQLDASGNASVTPQDVDNGSNDACGIAGLALDDTEFTCTDEGGNTVILTVTDNNGNTSSCTSTVTVEDNVAPALNCVNINIDLGLDCTASIEADDVSDFSDACGIASATVDPNTFDTSNEGPNTVTVTVTDANGNVSTCTAVVTVQYRETNLEFVGELSAQYSDYPLLSAHLTDAITGNGVPGKTITFTIGGRTVSATTNNDGFATTTSLRINHAPGNYTVESVFAGDDCYNASSDSDPFEVFQEDARVAYTGISFASTGSSNSGDATVLLSATVCDISNSPDAGSDDDPGNIANATVTFYDRGTGNPISPALPVVPLPGDSTKGTVSYEWSVDIGNADFESFIVGTVVDNYYTRDSPEDDAVITIAIPGCEFITGGGYQILENSEGLIAGDPGSRFNFGFNVKYNPSGTNLQGRLTAIVRRTESDGILHVYQIKGNRMTSLGIDPSEITNFAEFTGNANVTDVTDPDNPVSVIGNGTLRMFVTDNGEPGAGIDLLGMQLFRQGQLIFSNNWTGTQTAQQLIDGGNIVIHGCNGPPDPCEGTGDSDEDGVCDALDVCPGGDDNVDTDGDGTPDFCDDCDNITSSFSPEPLTHSGAGSSSSTVFLGGGTDVSFTIQNVNSKLNGPARKQFIDVVVVTYTDGGGFTQTHGTFIGNALPSPSVDVSIPGTVIDITITLSNQINNNVLVEVGMTDVTSCEGPLVRVVSSPEAEVGIDEFLKDNIIEVGEIISNAYPNPFRNQVVIEFTLPEGGQTILEVISLSGERIKLVDLGTLDENIRHTINVIPGDDLSGGTYIYRIISGKHSATGKLLYMK